MERQEKKKRKVCLCLLRGSLPLSPEDRREKQLLVVIQREELVNDYHQLKVILATIKVCKMKMGSKKKIVRPALKEAEGKDRVEKASQDSNQRVLALVTLKSPLLL